MSITAMKQALETLEKITKPHPFTRQVAAILRTAIEQAEKQCCCGEPAAFGVVHRTDGPCYVAEKQEPIECETQPAVTEDGYCEWVCPTPAGYLMQCCDCKLIHEVEFRVAKYNPRPSEAFAVVNDPDVQCQLRMKRRDDISPAAQPASSLVSDAELAQASKRYTAPPAAQRQPLTDEQIDAACRKQADDLLDHIYEYGTAAEGIGHRIRAIARAVEAKLREKTHE